MKSTTLAICLLISVAAATDIKSFVQDIDILKSYKLNKYSNIFTTLEATIQFEQLAKAEITSMSTGNSYSPTNSDPIPFNSIRLYSTETTGKKPLILIKDSVDATLFVDISNVTIEQDRSFFGRDTMTISQNDKILCVINYVQSDVPSSEIKEIENKDQTQAQACLSTRRNYRVASYFHNRYTNFPFNLTEVKALLHEIVKFVSKETPEAEIKAALSAAIKANAEKNDVNVTIFLKPEVFASTNTDIEDFLAYQAIVKGAKALDEISAQLAGSLEVLYKKPEIKAKLISNMKEKHAKHAEIKGSTLKPSQQVIPDDYLLAESVLGASIQSTDIILGKYKEVYNSSCSAVLN